MNLQAVYLVVAIAAALVTITVGLRQVAKRTEKAVGTATSTVQEAASKLEHVIGRADQRALVTDVDQYEAVAAANNALRQVIADSTRQLAEAATQVAMSAEELRKVRIELAQAVQDKVMLQARVTSLEGAVRELTTKLEYFTKPQFGDGSPQH